MRVAAIQFAPVFKDYTANLAIAKAMTLEAVEHGAQIVCLPELALTGYSFMSEGEAAPFAEVISDYGHTPVPSMDVMGALVAKHKVAVAWGLVEKNIGTGKLHNSQVLMYPGGHVSYQKIGSFGQDWLWSTPGTTSPPIVEWKGKRIGLMICKDVRNKGDGFTEFYEKGDADIVAFSSNFGDGAFPATSWMEFAIANKTWFVVSNRFGVEENNDFGEGGICIIEPSGKVHCDGLKWNEPCIVYADIP